MSVDTDISGQLKADAGIAALTTAVWAATIPPRATYPLLVYMRVSDVPMTGMDAVIYARTSRYQVSCYALTRPVAVALAEQVVLALQGYTSASIKAARYENMLEIVEYDAGPAGVPLYHIPVDFMIIS